METSSTNLNVPGDAPAYKRHVPPVCDEEEMSNLNDNRPPRRDLHSTSDPEFPDVRVGTDIPLASLPPQANHLNRYRCNADVYSQLSDTRSRELEASDLDCRSPALNTSRVPNKLPASPSQIAGKKVDCCIFLRPQD